MTHITLTFPASLRRIPLPVLTVPRLGLAAALAGLGRAYGEAVSVACFMASRPGRSAALPDPELEGRDPRW